LLLSQAIEGFLLDRDGEADDDLSPHTLTLYKKCLAHLVRYLKDPALEQMKPEHLIAYMTYLEKEYRPTNAKTDRLSGYARDNHWKAIRSFMGWCQKRLGISRIDLDLPRPAFAEEEIIPYCEDEVRQILAACLYTKMAATDGRKSFKMRRPTATRDRAIILLLLETGIRLGELSRLKIEDVNLTAGEIHVRPFRTGKKSKPRTIPIEKGCKRVLWLYQTQQRQDALYCEPFFPIAYHTVQSLFMRIEERTGIPDVHAHRFRHTFAIQYLRNGGNIFTLQRILGHATLEMCRRYLAIAMSDIKDAHRRASPVDRWRL